MTAPCRTAHPRAVAALVAFLLVTSALARPASAATQPAPSVLPSSTPQPAPAAPPQLPWNFDPCGGAQELLEKYGLTPCVVVGGEAVFAAGYTSAKINGTIQIQSRVLPELEATTSALVRSYPSGQAIVGLGPFTQIQITPPSYTRVDTVHFPALVSGSTDWKVAFKYRIAFDPVHGTIVSVQAALELPTGTPPLQAIAPIYAFDLIGEKAWPNHLALLYDMHLIDSGSPTGGRVWTLSPTVVGAWLSPGNLLAGGGAVILPNGKTIPLLVLGQLFNRHLGIEVTYSGFGASGFSDSTQPGLPLVSAINTNANVNGISVTLLSLVGKSGP